METPVQNRKYLWLLWTINLVVAVAFTVFYLWFTSDIVLEGAGQKGNAVLTYDGGVQQAAYRYGGMSVAVVVLQGLLYILNSGVVPFVEPESSKGAAACLRMSVVSTLLIMTLTVLALVIGWPHAMR